MPLILRQEKKGGWYRKMNCRLLNDEYEWKHYVEKNPDATVYHLLEWKRVMKKFGHKPLYLVCEEDGRIKGVMPLFYVKGIFGKRIVSVPLRDRGGPLFDDEAALGALLDKSIEMCKEMGCDYVEIKSAKSLPLVSSKGFLEKKELIDISVALDKNTKGMWELMGRDAVRNIKKSLDFGVKCRWSRNPEDLNKFYRLFIKTRKRLGVPPYPYSLFKNMMEDMGEAFRLIVAEYGGKIVSSAIMFAYNKTLIDAYSASDENFLQSKPNNALIWEVIKWGAENGFDVFDFGADHPSCGGLIEFKSRWGGIKKEFYSYFYLNKIKKIPESWANESRLTKGIWQMMPSSLSKLFGRFATKQVS